MRQWSKIEDEYLKANYGRMETRKIAKNLVRDVQSVYNRAYLLHLKLIRRVMATYPDGKVKVFDNPQMAADFFGFKRQKIYNLIHNGRVYEGITFDYE